MLVKDKKDYVNKQYINIADNLGPVCVVNYIYIVVGVTWITFYQENVHERE